MKLPMSKYTVLFAANPLPTIVTEILGIPDEGETVIEGITSKLTEVMPDALHVNR